MTRLSHEDVERLRAGVPLLPLTPGQARYQGFRLRVEHGLPYPQLAAVIGVYHGVWVTPETWRKWCRGLGAPVSRPHNVPPHARKKVAA